MDEHDLLWYDRAEPDEPPGPILNALAYLALLLMAGCMLLVRVYWLPDALWRRSAGWIERP